MRITDLLDKRSISLTGAPASKQEALDQMVDLMIKSEKINDREAYRQEVYRREEESTTGIGEGIAIPHGKGPFVDRPGLAAMVVKDGVDFDSLDGEPVHLIFLIAAPNTKDNVHLDVLSKLSMLLMDEGFADSLKHASTVEEFLQIVDKADDEKPDLNDQLAAQNTQAAEGAFKILAVTSCPTGIAHTYMAAEGLEKAARAAGCFIKVETRGSGGAKNVLTDQEIREADCIIVAADAKVPMDRFHGKKLIECQVSDGISKADQLVARAMSGDVPVYQAGNPSAASSSQKASGGIGHKLYMQLMNGVSHMLPFVVGGGILIALAFLIDGLCVDVNALSDEARAAFGTITPAAATLKGIGDVAFGFMLPILAGFIAMGIADRPGLAVGFVGGMMASAGKSGFLGALAAGFIAGYLMLFLIKAFSRLPQAIEKIAPVLLYPLCGILFMGLIMQFLVEPPIGALNTALNTALTNMGGSSRILLGIVVAGMMAIDMGGPFNKAAYVFGTGMLALGTDASFQIMASVMIGGMVPPIAIALSTTFFKDRWTADERKNGPVNYIMGLSFITEGAIPYAASDPLRVIPSCVVGSAVAGGLSWFFGCTLMAPHGGIFVVPVIGGALMYLVALAVGSVAGMFMLALLKKKRTEV